MNYLQSEENPVKRYGGLSIVVLLHVVLAYALLTGLAKRIVNVVNQPVETKIIDEVQPPPPEAPPPPPPKIEAPPPPFVPLPEVQIQEPPPQNTIAQVANAAPQPSDSTAPPVAAAPGDAAPAPPAPVPAFMDLNACKPAYPRAAVMSEEQGTVRVQFTIGAAGQLVAARVLKSSGYRNLDDAAVKGLSRCKFRPAYQNGNPVQSSFVSDYVWSLNDASG